MLSDLVAGSDWSKVSQQRPSSMACRHLVAVRRNISSVLRSVRRTYLKQTYTTVNCCLWYGDTRPSVETPDVERARQRFWTSRQTDQPSNNTSVSTQRTALALPRHIGRTAGMSFSDSVLGITRVTPTPVSAADVTQCLTLVSKLIIRMFSSAARCLFTPWLSCFCCCSSVLFYHQGCECRFS